MKTIFIKQNSNRLPQYQTMTTIVEDDSGRRYAIKEPLHEDAKKHIDNIFFNYELLKNQFNINLVKPTKKSNQIEFEMAEGQLMEKLMSMALEEENPILFESYIQKFVSYVDQFVIKRNIEFQPCDQFKAVFGEWTISEPQDILECANIDMIFGNLFISDDKFTLIDYEWVFEFCIPKSFIVWRAIFVFSIYHNIESYINNLKPFLKYHENFLKLDHSFNDYVYGKKKKYLLSDSVKKARVPLSLDNDMNLFIQLFFQVDGNSSFSEKNSIILPIAQDDALQEFTFDLSNVKNIGKTLRIDPLNKSCIVQIKSINAIISDQEIDLLPLLYSNEIIQYDNNYFYITDDPQIHFNNLEINELGKIQKISIKIYYKNIGEDAISQCCIYLHQEVVRKETDIQNLCEKLADTETNIKSLHQEVVRKEMDIQCLNQSLARKETNIQNLYEELVDIYTSKSWKLTRPLRNLKRMIKGQ